MKKSEVYEAVGKAIKAASGKSFAEAQKLVSEAVWDLAQAPPEETFSIAEPEPEPVEIPASIIRPSTRIKDLKPVGAPPRSVVRQQHTTDYMQNMITENTPDMLEFIPENTDKVAHLARILTVSTDNPPCVSLAYMPKDNDPNIPFPKKMFFSTDDESEWDFKAIVEKMRKDAASMYRLRTTPIVTRMVRAGNGVVIGRREEV